MSFRKKIAGVSAFDLETCTLRIENGELKTDVEILLDCLFAGKKIDNYKLNRLVNRHGDIICKKITLNQLRQVLGLEPINEDKNNDNI